MNIPTNDRESLKCDVRVMIRNPLTVRYSLFVPHDRILPGGTDITDPARRALRLPRRSTWAARPSIGRWNSGEHRFAGRAVHRGGSVRQAVRRAIRAAVRFAGRFGGAGRLAGRGNGRFGGGVRYEPGLILRVVRDSANVRHEFRCRRVRRQHLVLYPPVGVVAPEADEVATVDRVEVRPLGLLTRFP